MNAVTEQLEPSAPSGSRRVAALPQGGFTLIELLITVAIVGIVAVIALSSYRQSIQKGVRADAKSILVENAQFMERNFTTNNCYHRTDADCATTASSVVLPALQSPKSGTAKYNISFVGSPTATTFTIQAVPTGGQASDTCGTLTLTNTGAQTPATAGCW
jgi:type IV pilus assembly protein PilE